jgi:formiminoglutamase
MNLPHDPLWPRASSVIAAHDGSAVDALIVGVPASATSISETGADATPGAIRNALARYSFSHSNPAVNVAKLKIADERSIEEPPSYCTRRR